MHNSLPSFSLAVIVVLCLVLEVPAASQGLSNRADVIRVGTQGRPGAYRFRVGIQSPDQDCDRYANWWEVITPEGKLLYRRTLMHSHPREQPFTRAGGPIPVKPKDVVIVRAHLHPDGYGGIAFRGSVLEGFEAWSEMPPGFASSLGEAPPTPARCLY